MSAPDVATVATVLAEHRFDWNTGFCGCDWPGPAIDEAAAAHEAHIATALLTSAPIAQALAAVEAVARVERRLAAGDGIEGIRAALWPPSPPPRDQTDAAAGGGLEARYRVEKINDPSGKHDDCRYFVLDPKHDPLAIEALTFYAGLARGAGLLELARGLAEWIDHV